MTATETHKPMTENWVTCPKHGTHKHVISSTIPGHEGVWCQVCWLELLGPPLPSEKRPFEWKQEK